MHASSDDRRILRASDAERDAAIERLRHHGSVGRLSMDELTERIDAALEAKTLGQLDALFFDLPDEPRSPVALPPPVAAPVAFRPWHSPTLLRQAAKLLVINLVCLGLWATGVGHPGFWPAWIILISVAIMARRTSRAAARAEREARRASRRQTPPPFLGR